MLKNLFQKIFSFAKDEDKKSGIEKRRDVLSECFALLRTARQSREENRTSDELDNLEKVIDIIERERL